MADVAGLGVTEIKVKGQDPEFLNWALAESQRRKPLNAAKRKLKYLWRRYGSARELYTFKVDNAGAY